MMNNLIARRVEEQLPHVIAWFESEINFDTFREHVGKDEAESIFIEAIASEGFPPNTEIDELDFDFIAMNLKDTTTLIVEYIETQTDLTFTATDSELEEALTSESNIIDFRLSNLNEMQLHMVINDELQDFMERHAYYDDNYFAKRMEQLYEPNKVKTIIESREVMALNNDYFIERFRSAVNDINLTSGMFSQEETPIKVKTFQVTEPFESLAERYASKLYNYANVTDYLNRDFYSDLFKDGFVYYQLELNVDIEDYEYE